MNALSRIVLVATLLVLVAMVLAPVPRGRSCYGPIIHATINKTHVQVNEPVIITGNVCRLEENKTAARVVFVTPNEDYVEQWCELDENRAFNFSYAPEIPGKWTVYVNYEHNDDRFYITVGESEESSDETAASAASFLGTGIPMNYGYAGTSIISVAITVIIAYLFFTRRQETERKPP